MSGKSGTTRGLSIAVWRTHHAALDETAASFVGSSVTPLVTTAAITRRSITTRCAAVVRGASGHALESDHGARRNHAERPGVSTSASGTLNAVARTAARDAC